MAKLIQFQATVLDEPSTVTIDLSALRASSRRIQPGLIAPARENVEEVLAEEHSADPIKSLDTIQAISDYCIANGRYRDNMLFIVGINFGLRVSDLLTLRFSHLINPNFTFKETFPVFERKTRNTRKHKRNRYITINQAVMDAVTLYLEHTPGVSLSDFMFRSQSRNSYKLNKPMDKRSVERILKGLGEDLDIPAHMSTHCLRKTFCYHQLVMSNNDPRKLYLLQQMLGHSSLLQTLMYAGITQEEISEAYSQLNLGSREYNYLAQAQIIETDLEVVPA